MKMFHSYRRLLRAVLALLVAGCSWSCIYERETDCPDASRNGIVLNLHVVTQGPATRSEGHTLVAGTTAENYLNIAKPDFAVFVFDGNGRLTQSLPLASAVLITDMSADYSVYSLTGRMDMVPDEIQVMVVANWGSFSNRYGFGIDQTLGSLYKDGNNWNFKVPYAADGMTWYPEFNESDPGNSRTIPMFGISEKISLSLLKGREDKTIYLMTGGDYAPIYMLRSLAKIEVIYSTQQESMEMTGCSLSVYNTVGRFIPDVDKNGDWNVAATQVTSPSLPDNPGSMTAGMNGATALKFFQATRSPGQDVFVAYIPEMSIDNSARPQINVDISMPTIGGGTTVRPYSFAFDNFTDGKANGTLNAVLRNHIYSYTLRKSLISGEITVDYTVCPWEEFNTDITFN